MSNTASVIPVIIIGCPPLGIIIGTVALALWLEKCSPEDKAAVERLKEEQKRERLSARNGRLVSNESPVRLTSASLHLRSTEPLQRTAEKLGYRTVKSVSNEPHILLARPSGERLAIGLDKQGQVTVTANNEGHVKNLVRCHTVDRAVEHMKGKGMKIQTASLPNGEIRITGNERRTRKDGKAKVTTQVHSDGSLFIDVDNVKSNRCESIVSELADAVGGKVSDLKLKNSYQLPVSDRRRVKL